MTFIMSMLGLHSGIVTIAVYVLCGGAPVVIYLITKSVKTAMIVGFAAAVAAFFWYVQGLRSEVTTAAMALEAQRQATQKAEEVTRQTAAALAVQQQDAALTQGVLQTQLAEAQRQALSERTRREAIIATRDSATTCADSPAMRAYLDGLRADRATRSSADGAPSGARFPSATAGRSSATR